MIKQLYTKPDVTKNHWPRPFCDIDFFLRTIFAYFVHTIFLILASLMYFFIMGPLSLYLRQKDSAPSDQSNLHLVEKAEYEFTRMF